jgi:hypothetical protein
MSFISRFVPKGIRGNRGEVTDAARNSEFARRMREEQGVTAINNSFADPGREQQRQSFVTALRSRLGDATDRGFETASRQNLFRTARAGLTGGSTDISRQRRGLESLFEQRTADEGQAQGAYADLLAGDEAQRSALVSSLLSRSNPGAGAMQGMLRSRAGIANYRAGMHPQFLEDTGRAWDQFGMNQARGGIQRGNQGAYGSGFFAGGG